MKRGVIAAGALAAGASALDTGTSEPSEGSSSADSTDSAIAAPVDRQSDPLVLVPLPDFNPGLSVRVVDRLPAPTTVQLLRLPNDETVSVLTQPDEYTGYVVRSEPEDERVHSTTFVFTRGTLETGGRYRFGTDAKVFSMQLNLFRATARRVDSDDGANGDGGNSTSEETNDSGGA